MGSYIKTILDALKTSDSNVLNNWCNDRYKKNKEFMLKNGEYCTTVKDTGNYPKGTIFKAINGDFSITTPKGYIPPKKDTVMSEEYGNLTPEEIIKHDIIMEKLKNTPNKEELMSMAKIIGFPKNMIEMTTMPRDKIKEIYDKLNGQFINGPRPQEYIDIRNSGKTEWFPALNEYIMFFIFRPDQSSKSTFGETCKSNSFFIFVLLLIIALMAYIFYTNKSVINLPFKRSMFGRRR